jgi:hypothetical protein
MRNISARKKTARKSNTCIILLLLYLMVPQMFIRNGAWSTKLDASLSRVSIGYVFAEIVTELETYHIYKTVL